MKEIEKDTDGKIPHVSGLEALTLLYHFILSSILHYNANLHLKLYVHHLTCFSKVSFPLEDKLHQGKKSSLSCILLYYRNVHIPVENSGLPDIGFKKPCIIQKKKKNFCTDKVLKQTKSRQSFFD